MSPGRRLPWLALACAALAGASSGCGGADHAADDERDAGRTSGQAVPSRPSGVTLCYSDHSSGHAATLAFSAAFAAADLDARAEATARLRDAAVEEPAEEQFAVLHGLANLWRLAEPLPEERDDSAGTLQAALTARNELERAYRQCPTDHRLPAWLGPVLVRTGRVLNSDETIAAGLEVLQQGIDHYPSFVLFSKMLVFADRPSNDPEFAQALDAVMDNMTACRAGELACSNGPHAAHNVEGASVFLGDVFAKAGARDAARAAYDMARQSAVYEDWAYASLLEARTATLDERVLAFANRDADDDPASIWESEIQCAICHREHRP